MADRDLVMTGISGLDSILSDGIPRGNLILLEGAIGTGKTTLGVEFVYRGASQFDEPGIIVLFEVSPDRIVRDAARLGWDLEAAAVPLHDVVVADDAFVDKAADAVQVARGRRARRWRWAGGRRLRGGPIPQHATDDAGSRGSVQGFRPHAAFR